MDVGMSARCQEMDPQKERRGMKRRGIEEQQSVVLFCGWSGRVAVRMWSSMKKRCGPGDAGNRVSTNKCVYTEQ